MQHRGNRAAAEAAKEEMAAREEMENLQRVFSFLLDNGPDKKVGSGNVTKDQLYKTLKRLQYPNLTMKVVEDMIWEVDENCDGMLGWEEFKEMFFRVRQDKIGWEPRRLFNCVEFMMYDKDQGGTIDMDECMQILFRRFGKANLEARVNEFMTHDTNSDSEISFAEFMVMTQKSDMASTAKHPGFKLSAGMIETTKQENARLIRQIRN